MDPATITIIEGVVLDVIAWIRKRHAESGELPTDAEVIARAKAKIDAIKAEGEQFEAEQPPT